MLELYPPKIAWPISICIGSLLFSALSITDFLDATPSGSLREVQGKIAVHKTGRYTFPLVVGNWGIAKCDLIVCARSDLIHSDGKNAIAVIDENNKIFNLKVNGLDLVSFVTLKKNRNQNGFLAMCASVVCILALFFTFKTWKQR